MFFCQFKGSWLFKLQTVVDVALIEKLVPGLYIVVQNIHLYAPCSLLICDIRGLLATLMYRQGAYVEKKCFNRNLELILPLGCSYLPVLSKTGTSLYGIVTYISLINVLTELTVAVINQ
jgi:hypothetical protein